MGMEVRVLPTRFCLVLAFEPVRVEEATLNQA